MLSIEPDTALVPSIQMPLTVALKLKVEPEPDPVRLTNNTALLVGPGVPVKTFTLLLLAVVTWDDSSK
jgi:hypothetical protein